MAQQMEVTVFEGRHSRVEDGKRVTYKKGDKLKVTQSEFDAFRNKFVAVGQPAPQAAAVEQAPLTLATLAAQTPEGVTALLGSGWDTVEALEKAGGKRKDVLDAVKAYRDAQKG
jgi:hypothetical protein